MGLQARKVVENQTLETDRGAREHEARPRGGKGHLAASEAPSTGGSGSAAGPGHVRPAVEADHQNREPEGHERMSPARTAEHPETAPVRTAQCSRTKQAGAPMRLSSVTARFSTVSPLCPDEFGCPAPDERATESVYRSTGPS
ncbi:hypothetical protein [Streptomyces gibsoniae]|uniref:Uncharacterized protein n=1 Tax=Streptomyces gibsoniae TaxID=3075529 RepID=A0ABU2U8I5_9ACTN|nr:hypothetical protein [Streptomyces sp. DSM 41699]MDT0469483.1 hypothetical protein [Streptomyces sp. DSM 41699]